MLIIIDIETRSSVDLKACGVVKYANDESTEILCIGVQFIGSEYEKPKVLLPSEFHKLKEYVNDDNIFIAHNAFFEYTVLKAKGIYIPLHLFRCTMAFAALMNLPLSLGHLSEVLDLTNKKDNEGHRLMLKACKTGYVFKTGEEQRLYDYCLMDVMAETELYYFYMKTYKEAEDWFSTQPENIEYRIYSLTQKINSRGIPVDVENAGHIISYLEKCEVKLLQKFKSITLLDSPGQRNKVMEWCKNKGFPLVGYTKSDIETHLKNPNIPDEVKIVLKIRLLTGKSSVKKIESLKERAYLNRVHDLFMYRGAHTGRWTARGFQPQNLVKSSIPEESIELIFKSFKTEDFRSEFSDVSSKSIDPFTLASQCIRPLIKASEDKILFGGDFKSIETRVLWWLCGDFKGLESFKTGDPYIDMAAIIYDKPKEEITKEERFLGKTVVLGCGYGMGAAKFRDICEESYGLKIEDSFAQLCVNSYRNSHKAVVNYWYAIEKKFIRAIEKNKTFMRFKEEGMFSDFIYNAVDYSSSRGITYKGMSTKAGGSYFSEVYTYGGKITENIVQSIARDIMANSMLLLEKYGFPIIMTVHDEIICEHLLILEGDEDIDDPTKGYLDNFKTIMCRGAEHLHGIKEMDIPIDVEVWMGKRYFK